MLFLNINLHSLIIWDELVLYQFYKNPSNERSIKKKMNQESKGQLLMPMAMSLSEQYFNLWLRVK